MWNLKDVLVVQRPLICQKIEDNVISPDAFKCWAVLGTRSYSGSLSELKKKNKGDDAHVRISRFQSSCRLCFSCCLFTSLYCNFCSCICLGIFFPHFTECKSVFMSARTRTGQIFVFNICSSSSILGASVLNVTVCHYVTRPVHGEKNNWMKLA